MAYLVPLGLLVLAWAMTTPPWAGPDEAAQYIKALGTVSANPIGHGAVWVEPEVPMTPAQRAYFGDTSRRFPIDPKLAPRVPTIPCFAYHPSRSAACATNEARGPAQDIAYVGTYQPVYFVLPGLAAHLAGSPAGGLRAARLTGALEFLALVGGALALLDRRGKCPPPIGVLLVLTPMTLSLGGVVNSSGFEVAAAVLFMCSCVRVAERPPTPTLLAVFVGSGTLLAWSRPLGPLWVAGGLVVAGVLAGWTVVASRARDHWVRPAAAALTALTLASGVWDLALGFGSGVARSSLPTAIHDLIHLATTLFQQQIGVFGFLDTVLPKPVYVACEVLAAALLITALVLGRARQRLALVAGIAFYVLVTLVVFVTTTKTGFPVQGRYFLPLWAFVAVLMGETLGGAALLRGYGVVLRRLVTIGVVAFAALNVGSVYVNARRYAVGTAGPELFFRHPAWTPPGGWYLWLGVLALSGLGLVITGLTEIVPRRGEEADQVLAGGPTRP
ncbi:MAG: DUF2142 domain-containing protein [Acidimicrobiales bacterium]